MNRILHIVYHLIFFIYYLLKTIVLSIVPLSFYPRKSVKNEVVLITGGANGLGRKMAVRFSQLGARIVIWDVDRTGSLETCRLVRESGGQITSYYCDVADRKAVYDTAAKLKSEVGKVDIIVNSAGIVYCKTLMELSDDKIQRVFEVNALANFWVVKAFLPEMMGTNHGHIVSMSSISGSFGVDLLIDYSSSKHALNGFDESLRLHLIANGCDQVYTTNCCTYMVDTGMFHVLYNGVLPMMKIDYAVNKMMTAILTNTDTYYLPGILYIWIMMRGFISPHALFHMQNMFSDRDAVKTIKVRELGMNGLSDHRN